MPHFVSASFFTTTSLQQEMRIFSTLLTIPNWTDCPIRGREHIQTKLSEPTSLPVDQCVTTATAWMKSSAGYKNDDRTQIPDQKRLYVRFLRATHKAEDGFSHRQSVYIHRR